MTFEKKVASINTVSKMREALAGILDARGCERRNHDGSIVVKPEWVQKIRETIALHDRRG